MLTNENHRNLEDSVLSTLMYFDIFDYPLKSKEVFEFLAERKASQQCVDECLYGLMKQKRVFLFGDLYGLQADERNFHRRIRGNTEATRWLAVADRRADFIGRFPFVRAVMVSGSLSKGYMDDKSDLDFFIVTAPGRLWIARTLLVLYKRVFLRNCHKEFCVNYFVDSSHLEIEEKNLYTATELVTLIPLYNQQANAALMKANEWVRQVFPNYPTNSSNLQPAVPCRLKSMFEMILSPIAIPLDRLFMHISLRRWMRIYGAEYARDDFEIAFKTTRHVSKNHPNYYQKIVLDRFERKRAELEKQLEPADKYE